jgi:hypothetical protein
MIIILVVILAGINIYFFGFRDKGSSQVVHRMINSTTPITDDEGNIIGKMNLNIEADIEVTQDCDGRDCFEEKFAACEPATVTLKLMENIIYYYEIIGPKDGLCEVKSKFTANPNPEWVDEEMICKYDNTKGFETSVEDMSNCEGSLYTLMTGG